MLVVVMVVVMQKKLVSAAAAAAAAAPPATLCGLGSGSGGGLCLALQREPREVARLHPLLLLFARAVPVEFGMCLEISTECRGSRSIDFIRLKQWDESDIEDGSTNRFDRSAMPVCARSWQFPGVCRVSMSGLRTPRLKRSSATALQPTANLATDSTLASKKPSIDTNAIRSMRRLT